MSCDCGHKYGIVTFLHKYLDKTNLKYKDVKRIGIFRDVLYANLKCSYCGYLYEVNSNGYKINGIDVFTFKEKNKKENYIIVR